MRENKFENILGKAKETITQNDRVKNLLKDVRIRIDKLTKNTEDRSAFVGQLLIVIRMIRAHYTGQYTAFSTQTILTLVFGLLYFVTPMDAIPDFIPGLGFSDDISLLFFIFRSLSEDIANFKVWEENVEDIEAEIE